ncbi:MAG: DUF3810 domain-containing protein [Ruminococcus sp.]|nr:DUF3810 domain-containing protein [Ruminococcus sp.]
MKITERLKGLKKSTWALIILFLLCGVLLVLSRLFPAFCEWYAENIFPLWLNSFGRLTSLVPFSFGEALIVLGIVIVLLTLPAMAVLLIKFKGRAKQQRRVLKVISLFYLWVLCYVTVTETLNCFVLYRCPTFGEIYDIPAEEHTNAELLDLCGYLTDNCNSLAPRMQRDEEGLFVLTTDLDETAKRAMNALGEEFPRLEGFYVTPKAVKNSFFMSQQYLMGIYFPFTLEANYNREMYPSNLPETVCHELAHTRGFMLEDEANFIAFLACTRCEDTEYQYSGYLRALKYVLSQVRDNCTDDEINGVYAALCPEVLTDINGNASYWQSVQESDEGLLPSETVADIGDKAMEASLKMNGVEDGKRSYGRMVDLLLNYGVGYDEG